MEAIKVFEYDCLKVGEKNFTQKHFEALAEFYEKQIAEKKETFFNLGNKNVKFKQFVGVLKVGDLTIEVLPKIDRGKAENKGMWQKILLQMLIRSKTIPILPNNLAQLNAQKHTLFEAFIQLFLQEVERILADGLVKKYRSKEGNLNALKGRLMFGRHIAENIVHQERFYTTHTTYDTQHLLHQIIAKALRLIRQIGSENQPNLARILFDFPEMPDIKADETTFERVVYGRNTERYRQAMYWAKMLLLNYYPDVQNGHKEVFAIMFDMNKLWEKFVLAEMQRQLSDYEVNGQTSKTFWETKTVRPDIFLHKKDKPNIIVDTKWKIPKENTPSDEDLKQMFVYHLYFEADTTILLYPNNGVNKAISGKYKGDYKDKTLKMCYLDILDGDKLKESLDFKEAFGL
jgi:5-methylcytosine-specific restriction enzyme subunit McrC